MHVANGSIQTAASTLERIADTDNSGYIPTMPQRSIAPPDVNVPIHLDWDAFLLLLLLAATYAYKQYARIIKRKATKIVQVIRKKG